MLSLIGMLSQVAEISPMGLLEDICPKALVKLKVSPLPVGKIEEEKELISYIEFTFKAVWVTSES